MRRVGERRPEKGNKGAIEGGTKASTCSVV